MDSTPLAVCHNRHIYQHRVFVTIAQRGKSSVGWFFGFKLHLIVNDRGELRACRVSVANFMSNILCALIAYDHQPQKLSLTFLPIPSSLLLSKTGVFLLMPSPSDHIALRHWSKPAY
ncbi:MAG: hypothetical protein JNJ61_18705 [Anaerolineae bacterium]|nr:hypothetical protein [Anaerolineae bacterium]